MKQDIRKQYNNFANEFSINHNIGGNSNNKNRAEFYDFLSVLTPSQKILDLCCGDGYDAGQYKSKGFDVSAIDASEELIKIAKKNHQGIDFRVGLAEKLPYENNSFDAIVSKYSIMTSADMNPAFNEAFRVLKQGGYFIYLMTHPFRQYFEKRNMAADYFKQEVVVCNILNNTVKLHEPTHTFNEYLNKDFLSKFDIVDFKESFDPAAEQVDRRTYPGYFIVVCKKR
jgi:ubiquinone/menaquinone biosynthesis C-methylase UbiE